MMDEVRVSYEYEGRSFEGMIVCNGDPSERGVIFMQPDWTGVSPTMIACAREIARDDYVVLVADMFGAGYAEKPKGFDDLMAGMLAVHKNLPFTLGCGSQAYEALLTEAARLGLVNSAAPKCAVGYCAGGGFLLEQARAGQDFDAVTVLHVTNPNPVIAGTPCNIKGRVLAVHGAVDPATPKAKVHELEEELAAAGVDWQVMMFGEGRHAFCVPKESMHEAIRYDEKLCRLAYLLMHDFFAQTSAANA